MTGRSREAFSASLQNKLIPLLLSATDEFATGRSAAALRPCRGLANGHHSSGEQAASYACAVSKAAFSHENRAD